MGLQVEEAIEGTDPLVDILAPEGPSRVKTIRDNTMALWQTPSSLCPTAKKVERKYFVLSKDHEYFYTHSHQGQSWWQLPMSVSSKDNRTPC